MNVSHNLNKVLSLRLIYLLSVLSITIFIAQAKNTYLSKNYNKMAAESLVLKFDTSLEVLELFNTARLEYEVQSIDLVAKNERLGESSIFYSLTYFKIIAIGLIGVLLVTIVIMRKRRKKDKKEIQNISKQLDKYKASEPKVTIRTFLKKTNKNVSNGSAMQISMETLQRIKDKLEEFEENDLFLDPLVSALTLATYCQTNVRYISEVINKHKGQSISTYINHLRIEYILSLLDNDEGFRAYKITRLSEIAGFSSPSKFSTEFKRIVGVAPSVYIYKISQ